MTQLTGRAFRSLHDLEPALDLIITCRVAGAADLWPPAHELRAWLRAQAPEAGRAQLWEDQQGALLALALLWDGATLLRWVHPRVSERSIDDRILGWALVWSTMLATAGGERPVLFVPVRDDDDAAAAGLTAQGFTPSEWSLLRMQRSLAPPIAPPDPPHGFCLRPAAGLDEAAALAAAQRAVFYASGKTTAERCELMRGPAYQPDLDLVAVAPDGTLAAFCRCVTCCEENRRAARAAAWVELIGTLPAYRRHGLARELLELALRRLQAAGVDDVLLNTGSWNIPAQRLFAALGFRTLHALRWYASSEG